MGKDDWPGRVRPTQVDIEDLFRRAPKHRYCNLAMRVSKNNRMYQGLYCSDHGTLLQWLNLDQVEHLKSLGVPDERVPEISPYSGKIPRLVEEHWRKKKK